MKDGVCTLSATVLEAHALGGTKMFEVKVACKGKSTSVYKSKEDFKSVLDMFRLVSAMCRAKSDRCEVCAAACSATSAVRVGDEDALDAFLGDVLAKLRKAEPELIERCSSHRGVVQILMEFLNVRNGKYFCELTPEMEEELSPTSSRGNNDALLHDEVDLDHPVSRCSLNRTLSEQFAAMDSVC
ncbi:Pre-mRNA-splicing factor ATP-dependent RNA helicase [Phytophthora cinnamomi]|uniref:Pre-mRNA-splicing factor ATP-dependent RNA helicase n=1 Tax=Phytophthora cinnamomi TaxID=4785 RepID=UPI0035596952|nr:Pre-mRNA-splicing factor ATP-dependent RNA helicase [Phytophthora cinnamomi]